MNLVSGLRSLATKGAKEAVKKPFYSAVDKAILDIVEKQPKATGDQYLGMILKTKGVKPAEIKDRGLESALKGRGKMSGQDLIKTAEDRPAPQIRETKLEELIDDYDEPAQGGAYYVGDEYNKYRTPGGQNYREILIKLPQPKANIKPITAQDLKAQGYTIGDLEYDPFIAQAKYKLYDKDGNVISQRYGAYGVSTPEQALIDEAKRMTEGQIREAKKPIYKAPHFDDEGKNLLAHARAQDMTGPNGEKILVIDEIQSDWHQAGRKKGYIDESVKPKIEEIQNRMDALESERDPVTNKMMNEQEWFNLANQRDDLAKKLEGVADAPFKKNWHELVMKRLMDDAAKKGYDKVLITPGAVQARRYDLSQHVDKLVYHDESQYLMAIKDGEVKFTEKIEPSKLADYIGEETAQKLLSQEPFQSQRIGETTERILSGLDLEVGGEGMKGFYDTMLPSYMKKQYGLEAGQYPLKYRDLEVVRENRGEGFAVIRPGGGTVAKYPTIEEAQEAAAKMSEAPYHSFDITPDMRESITTQGQPLYQLAPVAGAVGAGMMATDEEPETYRKGGPVSIDAMRLAVLNKKLRK